MQEADSGVNRTPISPSEVVQDLESNEARVWLASMQGQPSLPVLGLVCSADDKDMVRIENYHL